MDSPCVADSRCGFDYRPLTPLSTTAPSVPDSMGYVGSINSTFSSVIAGLEGVPVQKFTTVKQMNKTLSETEFNALSPIPYLIFRPIKQEDLLKIENARESGEIQRNIRLTYYANWDTLIVKVPLPEHEVIHRYFSRKLFKKVDEMGIDDDVLLDFGSTKYKGYGVSKEGDTVYKPVNIRTREDWPSLVIEAGFSEPLTRLRVDSHLWLEKSKGDVKIVLIFSISLRTRTIIIEKWEIRPVAPNRPTTRSRPNTTPTQIQSITIDAHSKVTGAPLTLEFTKVFLRDPQSPQEHDIVFTAQELSEFANSFWKGME